MTLIILLVETSLIQDTKVFQPINHVLETPGQNIETLQKTVGEVSGGDIRLWEGSKMKKKLETTL